VIVVFAAVYQIGAWVWHGLQAREQTKQIEDLCRWDDSQAAVGQSWLASCPGIVRTQPYTGPGMLVLISDLPDSRRSAQPSAAHASSARYELRALDEKGGCVKSWEVVPDDVRIRPKLHLPVWKLRIRGEKCFTSRAVRSLVHLVRVMADPEHR
jgi:hypothetical protein